MSKSNQQEVDAIIKLVKKLVKEEKVEKARKGVIVSVDRLNNNATVIRSDYSFAQIPVPPEIPYVPGDTIIIKEDQIIGPEAEIFESVGGNELISNGDFNLGSIKYWDAYEFRSATIASGEAFITGNYFDGQVCGSWPALLYQDITDISILPKELYKHVGHFKTDSVTPVTVYLDGMWYDASGNELSTQYEASQKVVIDNNMDWQRVITYVRPPTDAAYARVKFSAQTTNTEAHIYMDNLSFWGKSQTIPGASIPGLPGLDLLPPLPPVSASGAAGVELYIDTYNFYIDVSFPHIDTLAFSSGSSLTWDNTDFDHYEIYSRIGAGDYDYNGDYRLTEYAPSGTSVVYRANGLLQQTTYDFMIKSADHVGNISTPVYASGIQTLYNKNPKKPTIDSSKSIFKTQDAEICWAPVTLNFDDTPSGLSGLTSDIKDYKVEVYCSGGLVRTEYAGAPNYLYNLAKNVVDNTTPQASGLFRVYARDFGDLLSSGSDVTLINYPPMQPSGLSANFDSPDATFVWTQVTKDNQNNTIYDFDKYKIELIPSGEGTQTFYTNATSFQYGINQNTTKNPNLHLHIKAMDKLGQESTAAETTAVNYPPMLPSGLAVDFTTSDCVISWNLVTLDDQGAIMYDFDKYHIEITPSGEGAEDYYSENPIFRYSYELNTHKKPNLTFRVCCLDDLAQTSAWASGSGLNVVPNEAPTPTALPAFQRVFVEWDSPEELAQFDFTMKDVTMAALAHCDTSSGSFVEIANLSSNFYVHDVEKDTHNFYKVRFIDIYNQSGDWSDVSTDAFTEKTITIEDLAGAAYQLTPTTSYSGTYVDGIGEGDITRLYDAHITLPAYFDSGEQWIQYEYPVSHIFNKTYVGFPSGDYYSFFLANKLASGDDWSYLAGDKDNLSTFSSKDDAYSNIISVSGADVNLTWATMKEARYTRFYFPSGAEQWASGNYLTELQFKTYLIADDIDAGTINLAKGINLWNDETGTGFRLDEDGAIFENNYITILGDGYTVIEGGKIYVRASGATTGSRDISELLVNVSDETLIEGGYIRTGSIDAEILRVAGEGYFSNIIENPSIEVVNTSGDFAKAWTATTAGVSYLDNSDFAKFSRHYFELNGASRSCASEFIQVRTDENAGEDLTFMLSTYIATDVNGYARVRLAQYDGADPPVLIPGDPYITIIDNFGSASAAYSWTRQYGVCNLDEDCYKVKILLESTSSSTSVYYDGIQLEDGNRLTDFKCSYKLGSIIIDRNGIIVDHPDAARTTIDADGIRVGRGRIYIDTDYGQIDLVNQIKVGGNIIYNPSFDLFKYDGTQLILEGWDHYVSGSNIIWGIETTQPDLEGAVGGKYVEVLTSGSSVGDFLELTSVKVPIESSTPLSLACYYYIPSGEDAVVVTAKVYRSANTDSPITSGYNFANDTFLNSGDYTLTACDEVAWALQEIEGMQCAGEGYVYVDIRATAAGACDAQPIKLGAVQLEVGDVCTKYNNKTSDFLSNKFSTHKLGMTKSFTDKYIIEGVVGSIEP